MQRVELVAQGKQTRATIVHAAATEFASRGYQASSLSDIAAVFRKPKTALRHHFGSKGELAVAVLEHQYAVWTVMIDEAKASGRRGLTGGLSLLAEAILDSLDNPYPGAAIQLLLNSSQVDVPIPRPPFSWMGLIEDYVREAQSMGEIPDDANVPLVARMLVDSTFGIHQLHYRKMSAVELQAHFTGLWTHLLLGLDVQDPDVIVANLHPPVWKRASD
jgi:AcrR family transcriptional regulator